MTLAPPQATSGGAASNRQVMRASNLLDRAIFDIEGKVFDGEFQSTPKKKAWAS